MFNPRLVGLIVVVVVAVVLSVDLSSQRRAFVRERNAYKPFEHKLFALPENYFKIISFAIIKKFARNSLKMSVFLGNSESANSLKNYEKLFSGSYFRNAILSEGNFFNITFLPPTQNPHFLSRT